MVPFILTAREHHGVKSPEDYRRKHAEFIGRKNKAGMRYMVHLSPIVPVARIDGNTWVLDCECGAGNTTDPAWGFACCFSCGAVHEQILCPSATDQSEIERLLLMRPRPMSRAWLPEQGETIETLIAENIEHGHMPSKKPKEKK